MTSESSLKLFSVGFIYIVILFLITLGGYKLIPSIIELLTLFKSKGDVLTIFRTNSLLTIAIIDQIIESIVGIIILGTSVNLYRSKKKSCIYLVYMMYYSIVHTICLNIFLIYKISISGHEIINIGIVFIIISKLFFIFILFLMIYWLRSYYKRLDWFGLGSGLGCCILYVFDTFSSFIFLSDVFWLKDYHY